MYYYLTGLNLPETKDKIVNFFLNTFLKSKIQLWTGQECICIELYITVKNKLLFFFGFLPIFFTVHMLHQHIQSLNKCTFEKKTLVLTLFDSSVLSYYAKNTKSLLKKNISKQT